MRLVIFDIQKPVDPQVNGFGLYRTVVDGTEPLLIGRFEIPLYPEYCHTHPWESADCDNAVDTQLTFNFTKGAVNSFTDGETFCTVTQIWEMLNDQNIHLNSEDNNGYVGTYPWEIRGEFGAPEGATITQTHYTYAFTTVVLDAGLGEAVETDHDIPPHAGLVCEFQESVFLAGENENPHYLRWSKRFHPESFPAVNFLEVGDANDPITAICPIAGVLGVFTRDTKYRVNGNATSGFVHFEAISHRGTRAYKSVLATEHGIIFVANDGVYTSNLIGADIKISPEIEAIFNPENLDEESTRLEEPLNQDFMHLVAACFSKSKYRFVYPSGTSEVINREAMFDFDVKKWTINTLNQASYFLEEDLDIVTAGGQDGKLYELESGTTDNGASISFQWTSKDFPSSTQVGRAIFAYFKVDAHVLDGQVLNAQFIVDDQPIHTAQITGHRTCVMNPLPENTQGHKWRITLYGSSPKSGVGVYGIGAYFIPLEGLANGT